MTTIRVQPQLGSSGVAAQAQAAVLGQALTDQKDIDQTQVAYERALNASKVTTAGLDTQVRLGALSNVGAYGYGVQNSLYGAIGLSPTTTGIVGTALPAVGSSPYGYAGGYGAYGGYGGYPSTGFTGALGSALGLGSGQTNITTQHGVGQQVVENRNLQGMGPWNQGGFSGFLSRLFGGW